MCGITGIINRSGQPVDEQELLRARDLARHRGPDGAGHWLFKNVGLGHRRLSIIGLGGKGKQPMKFGHVVVVHNGEIYNYLELREELSKHGYTFQSDTDTEVLAAAYYHWGQDCVQRFTGMWAFAIYDKKKEVLFCSRDRFGVKPFYFTEIGSKFCFASEIKQFTAIKGWQARMNEPRCREWLHTGQYDRTVETLFDGVFQLQAGHNLTFDPGNNRFETNQYYDLREQINPRPGLSFENAKTRFRELFYDAVRLQLRSEVKIGLTLSGGLDSSSLAAAMAEQMAGNSNGLESFSACFHQKGFNEEPFVDAVVKKLELVPHKVTPCVDDLLDKWAAVTWHLEEPLPNLGDLTHYLVFEAARRRGVKVNLCGQGADEILAGYDAFYLAFWKGLLRSRPLKTFLEVIYFVQQHPATVKKRLLRQVKGKEVTPFQKVSPLTPLQNTSLLFIETSVLPYILHSEDRLSMAHSIESRVPFLDHRLVEFCLSLPDDFKIKNGIRKRVMREAMRPGLPPAVYRRYDKIGFETPFPKEFGQLWPAVFDSVKNVERPGFMPELEKKPGLRAWREVGFLKWEKQFF